MSLRRTDEVCRRLLVLMAILFDESDLEPLMPAAPGTEKKKNVGPQRDESETPEQGSLFGGLEDEMGLEPLFAPAPIADARAKAQSLFGSAPKTRFEDGPFEAGDTAENPTPAAKLPSRAKRKKIVPVEPLDSEGPKIIRTASEVEGFARVREDGFAVEVDSSTCTDPEVFAQEHARRQKARGERVKPKKSLLVRAVDSLSRREHSRKDLERKLASSLEEGETRESVKEVLDRLEDMKLLSDERFAQMKVRAYAARMGDRKLRMELRRSGVDEETAKAALESLEEPEELRAWRIWRRKWSEPPRDWKEKEKMMRFLSYRGFGMSAIQKVIRGEVELPEGEEA